MLIFSRRWRISNRGFTLLELLAVMGIVVIVTGLLLVRQSQFNSSTLLRSLAYSIALSVRQAQVYGTSVFGVVTAQANCVGGVYSSGSCFASGYGVSFSSGDLTHYTLFGDLNGNGRFDSSPVNETVRTYALGQGYQISRFCAKRASGSAQDCYPSGVSGGSALTSLSIVFRRPNPDACFSSDISPTACSTGASAVYATSTIQVTGTTQNTRTISITSAGQIGVCPVNMSC